MRDLRKLYVGLVVAFIVTSTAIFLNQGGVLLGMIIGGVAMTGGLICWLLTTYKIPADPKRLLPLFLLTTGLLMFHIWEEYLFAFGPRVGALTGVNWTDASFLYILFFYLPTFWILGSIGIYYRHPLGNYIAWMILVGMTLGEVAHLVVFPILEGGRYHYFPGMWTALLPGVPGFWAIYVIVTDYKKAKQRSLA
jgi:hypothetical protein